MPFRSERKPVTKMTMITRGLQFLAVCTGFAGAGYVVNQFNDSVKQFNDKQKKSPIHTIDAFQSNTHMTCNKTTYFTRPAAQKLTVKE